MDPLIGSALIDAGASGIGALIGGITASHSANKQYKQNLSLLKWQDYYNKQNAQIAYQNQQALLQNQQHYQRQLMRDSSLIERRSLASAGLNPNLMSDNPYSGNVAAPSAPSVPQAGAAGLPSVQQEQTSLMTDFVNSLGNMFSNIVNARNTQEDTILKSSQKTLADALTLYNNALTTTEDELRNLKKELMAENAYKVRSDISVNNSTIDEINKRIQQYDSQIDVNGKLSNFYDKQAILVDRTTDLQILDLYASINLKASQGKLNDAQAAAAYKSIQQMQHYMRYLDSMAELNAEQKRNIKEATRKLALDGDLQEYLNSVNKWIPSSYRGQLERQMLDLGIIKGKFEVAENGVTYGIGKALLNFMPIGKVLGNIK